MAKSPRSQNPAPKIPNLWANAGKAAPFDQEFYFIINLAVGGTAYFSDNAVSF